MPTRRLAALAPLALLAGCATRLHRDDPAAPPRLQVQSPVLHPGNGGLAVDAQSLQPGDILLSAADAVGSLGIRLLTMAPVSHASLYVGAGEVAEAVPQGVRRRGVPALLQEESVVAAFRHPGMRPDHAERMLAFVGETVGRRYDFVGVMLHAPFALNRRLCELPLTPPLVRDFCIQGIGAVQLGLGRSDRFFCSQFVLEAYRRAGLPLTPADPRLLSPADLLHMREGDVPSVRSHQALQYVGHLKYAPGPPPQ